MKKNVNYIGVDEKYIPEDEKYVDDSLLGDKNERAQKIKKYVNISFGMHFFISIVLIIVFIVVGYFIFTFFSKTINEMNNNFNSSSSQMEDDYNKRVQELDVFKFNMNIKNIQGTKNKNTISQYLDEIVRSNKTNSEHIIMLTYNDKTTSNEDEIVDIKHTLVENVNYEVSVDYDNDGYICSIIIKDI